MLSKANEKCVCITILQKNSKPRKLLTEVALQKVKADLKFQSNRYLGKRTIPDL
jgi:hypothetical protein